MRAILRFLAGAVLLLAQLVAVFVFAGLASVAWSFLVAKTFPDDGEPPRHFPMVATGAGGESGRYSLVHWGDFVRWEDMHDGTSPLPARSFVLPDKEGRFTLDPTGTVVPVVTFRVLEESGGRHRIAVTWADDDYERHSRYVTDGTRIEPEYFRIWGASTAFVGILPGIVAAWLLGLAVRRTWRAWTAG